jgi:hypothetical protein
MKKNIPGLLGLGLKFEVVFGIGFLINFHATYNYKRRVTLCKTKLEKVVTKHAKRAVSFRLKKNETCETACFA